MIHPTAIIDKSAQLDPTVQVGPYAVIGANVSIGARTIIDSHVVIEGPTDIGSDNRFFPGAVIGSAPQDLKYQGAPSLVQIGDRNRFREFVTVNRSTHEGEVTHIGNDNLLMAYVHVAHNCAIADSVVIANGVALAGHVNIESRVTIGGVLGVHQFVHIGELAMLGGMSRIDRDVPPYMLIEGSPSRVRTLNLVGLKRASLSANDLDSLKSAFTLLYRSGDPIQQSLAQLELLGDNYYIQHLKEFLIASLSNGRRGPIPGKF